LVDPSLMDPGPSANALSLAPEAYPHGDPMTQPYYETMYILRPDIPEEEVETHVNKYRDLVSESGGEVLDCQMRGKRRLAYPIDKHREGIYVQLNHNGDGQQVAPLERAMRLSEDVIRYLTVKQDGPMPAPRSVPGAVSEAPASQTAEV
jgi:small subunit ribosomal protein S6